MRRLHATRRDAVEHTLTVAYGYGYAGVCRCAPQNLIHVEFDDPFSIKADKFYRNIQSFYCIPTASCA